MMKMKWIFAVLFSFNVWASGELPFPFSGTGAPPAISNHVWDISDTDLSLQIKVYVDDDGKHWAKLWVRQSDGFVWARVWMEENSSISTANILVEDRAGHVLFDWQKPENTSVELDGRRYALNLRP